MGAVRLRLSTGGLAFASKMRPAGLRDAEVEVLLERQHVRILGYPADGSVGSYERGSVRIQGTGAAAQGYRDRGRPAAWKPRWDDLDVLYFVGYALWNYLAGPSLLWQLPHEELPPWREGGQRWRRIRVRFPAEIVTHSTVQTFYLDEQDRIMRHDYVAEVFGRWAAAAHYGWDHVAVGDRWIATRRRVVPRAPAGRALRGPTLVWIRFDGLRAA